MPKLFIDRDTGRLLTSGTGNMYYGAGGTGAAYRVGWHCDSVMVTVSANLFTASTPTVVINGGNGAGTDGAFYLPSAPPAGLAIRVINRGNPGIVRVLPTSGGCINNQAANAAVNVASAGNAVFVALGTPTNTWMS